MKHLKTILLLTLIIFVSPLLLSACSLKRNLKASMISLEQTSYEYDGTEKKPGVTVTLFKTDIIPESDYTVSYSNNIEVGKASVTVTMNDDCEKLTGSVTVHFNITGIEISEINKIEDAVYNGKNQEPLVIIDGLDKDTDYSLSWEYKEIGTDDSNYKALSNNQFVDAGNYRVTATGKGHYYGSKTAIYTINKASYFNLSAKRDNYIYSETPTNIIFSSEIFGNVSFYYSTEASISSPIKFDKNTDFSCGTYYFYAQIEETKNSNYYRTPISYFNVIQFNISNLNILIEETIYEYTGEPICPKIEVFNNLNALILNQDYEVSYENNTYIGNAFVIVTGKGNYTGSNKIGFTIKNSNECTEHTESQPITSIIKKATINEDGQYIVSTYCLNCGKELSSQSYNINKINIDSISIESISFEYNGKEKTPIITINGLTFEKDYVVSYKNNINAGTAEAIITFIGNYEGSFVKTFMINKVVVKKPTFMTSEFIFNGNAQTAILLNQSEYFSVKGNLSQTDAGVYSVTISLNDKSNYIWENENNSSDFNLTFKINKATIEEPTLLNSSFTYNKDIQTATLSYLSDEFYVDGDLSRMNAGNYNISIILKDKLNYVWKNSQNSNDIILEFVIKKATIKKPTLLVSEFTYNGSEQTAKLSYLSDDFIINGNLSEINAGTYNLIVSLKDSLNFSWTDGEDSSNYTLSFIINKLSIEEPYLKTTEFIYNGNSQTAELSYLNNNFSVSDNLTQINAGEYIVTITLTDKNNLVWKNNNNSDDLYLEFRINGIDISSATINLSTESFIYNGEAYLPDVTVIFQGNTLTPFVDYLPIATNNINVGTATISVYGLSNYSGEATTYFTITPQKVTEPTIVGNYNYNGQPQSARFTGNTNLFSASGHIQTNVGTYDVTITLNDKNNYVWEKSGNTDNLILQFTIYGTSLNNVSVEFLNNKFEYTGEEIKPQVLVKSGRILLAESTDYTLNYKNNIDAGTAIIEINGMGSYQGTIVKEFIISPKEIKEPFITGTYTYNGTYQTAQLQNKSSLFSISNDKQYNAGTYIIIIKLNDKNNYIWKTSKNNDDIEIEFIIKPIAIIEPTITGYYLYDGSSKTATLSYSSIEFSAYNDTQIEPGVHYVNVTLKDKKNYIWQQSQTNEDLSLEFIIDESGVSFIDSDEFIHNLELNYATIPSTYSLSDHYLLMPENQYKSNLSWIFASLKTLETSLIKQNRYGEYHNFSEIGSAYIYYKNYILSKYDYSDKKDIDVVGDFFKFNLTAQNTGLFYENTFSNDLMFSLNKSNYKNYSFLEKHLDTSIMNGLKPINIGESNYFKNLNDSLKNELIKQYINEYGGIYTVLKRGSISCTNNKYSPLSENETSNNDSDGFIASSQSVCIIGWDDSKNAFLVVNSWGVSDSSYNYFWVPYSYSKIYNNLFGYIYDEKSDIVTLKSSYSGGSNGFTSIYQLSLNNPTNLFVYDEVFNITYNFSDSLNLSNMIIKAFQGDYDVSSLFEFEKVNNILTISAKDVSNLSGTYIFEFYLNNKLVYSKDVYVFTGTEISYVELLGGTYKTRIGNPVFNNNLASGNLTQTFYVADPYDSDYYLDFYLPCINNYTYKNTSISIGDIFITYTDNEGNIQTREKTSSDILKVTLESHQQFIPNRQRVLISHLFRTAFNSIVEINIKLKSPIDYGTGKTTIYKFIFIVSENKSAINDKNKIIYKLNGGLNNDKNITKYANYSVDENMTNYNLYDPTKENSTFLGWYLDENFTERVTTIDSSLSGEIILYAKWSD